MAHELELTDLGIQHCWRSAKQGGSFEGYVTRLVCTRCGAEALSQVPRSLAMQSGDAVAFRMVEVDAMARAMNGYECKLGKLRTARGAARMR